MCRCECRHDARWIELAIKSVFEINTTRMNNELIKQRLGCIPIYENNLEVPYEDYILDIDVKNDTDTIMYITTENFKVKNIKIY